ncbi:hypothetical protein BH11MYX2_BH11MYX2_20880 [soil metagenome]
MLRAARSIAAVIAATAVVAGCHAPHKSPADERFRQPTVSATKPDDTAEREQIAKLEASRGAGVEELAHLATQGDGSPLSQETRELALRALGRIGGARALAALILALQDTKVVAAAADARGVLASLDDLSAAQTATISTAVTDALRLDVVNRVALLTALGRAGGEDAVAKVVVSLTDNDRSAREAAAMAMARFGRRKIAWGSARDSLVPLVDDDAVRYAAIYALAREYEPPKGDQNQLAASLAKRLTGDADPMVRAVAAQALAHQGLVLGDASGALGKALLDKDWRVSIEAARALASDKSDDAGREHVADALLRRSTWANTSGFEDQAVVEMMRLLLPYANHPAVQQAFAVAEDRGQEEAPITRAWIECLAADARVRVAKGASYDELVKCPLLPHLVAPLVADLVAEKVGPIAVRRAQVAMMFNADDPRIQAASVGAMSALWPELKNSERDALVGQLASAIAAKDPLVAGAAIEAAEGFFEAAKTLPPKSPLTKKLGAIDAAVIKRAAQEKDVELASSVIELVGKRKLAPDSCRARLDGEPVIAAAARKCLRALGETPAEPTERAAATMPSFPLIIGGDQILWVLTTTRGEMRIELDPHEAPWAVSSIVALTEKHVYDGLEMHRVVPDFVAQGGDPTQSGAGGPGYTLPAEPSSHACFVEGGVGVADAGRDSAGSQWFIMHSPAPHLDARYTCVGRLVDGAKAANTLLIGDRVLAARIEHRPR